MVFIRGVAFGQAGDYCQGNRIEFEQSFINLGGNPIREGIRNIGWIKRLDVFCFTQPENAAVDPASFRFFRRSRLSIVRSVFVAGSQNGQRK